MKHKLCFIVPYANIWKSIIFLFIWLPFDYIYYSISLFFSIYGNEH